MKRGKEQSVTGRHRRRRSLLSLLCVLLLALTAGLHQPAAASISTDSSPAGEQLCTAADEHCPPADDGHQMAPVCAFAAGCALFLPTADIRLRHGVSASVGLPGLVACPLGQLLPPLIQPPERLLRL